jgi:hypothetical protein
MALIIGGQPQRPLWNGCEVGQVLADGDLPNDLPTFDIDNRYRAAALVGDSEQLVWFKPGGGDGTADERAVFERKVRLSCGGE